MKKNIIIIVCCIMIVTSACSCRADNNKGEELISTEIQESASQQGGSIGAMETFYGDGFELEYNGSLWVPGTTAMDGSDENIHALQYVLDKTILVPGGVTDMLGYSVATEAGRDEMYMAFYDRYKSLADTLNAYIVGDTDTFEVLKDNIYYASYCFYKADDDVLFYKTYVIASESDDMIVSFATKTNFLTKAGPDIPIMPVLETITFTGRPTFTDSYEQMVWESDDEYTIGDDAIPSLSKIMNDNNISYVHIKGEKTIGRMTVPSILNYFESPELVSVEIIEVTYNNVDDVWGAIDAYGRLLSESYDFRVTYPPTEYSNYGADYRFCELIEKPDSDKAGTIYVSAIYSQDEKTIHLQFGLIGTPSISDNGIGPLNLEAIEQNRF